MSTIVGLLLLTVFLVFALMMFLERLSAMLALPMMALTFILVAAGSDLLQPAVVSEVATIERIDEFGRRQTELRMESAPSRYQQWHNARQTQAALCHQKALLMAQVGQRLADVPQCNDGVALDQTAARLRFVARAAIEDERKFDAAASQQIAAISDPLAKPPHVPGARARTQEALAELAIAPFIRPLADLADEAARSDGDASRQAALLVQRLQNAAAKALRTYPAPPEPDAVARDPWTGAQFVAEHFPLVIRGGAMMLASTIIATIFGGIFAIYVRNLKVAERMVYWTAEFAGDRPRLVCTLVLVLTAAIFTSVGGLGTVIMIGTIALPILRSVGVSPVVGSGVFLIGMSMGGTLQPVARRLWLEFYGLPAAQVDAMLWTMVALYAVCGVAWILYGTRRRTLSNFHADAIAAPPPRETEPSVPRRLMIAPLIPVVLVYAAGVEEITTFTISLIYMYLCVCRQPGATRIFARSLIEGAQAVVPPVLLMLGIGMLLTALSTPSVQAYLRPLLSLAVPHTKAGYIATFALAAPLALYRGPLNAWGMGLAVSAILLSASSLPAQAVLGVILAAGMMQGICDPTNTANVWIAGYQGVTVNQILRATLVTVWIFAAVGVVLFGTMFVN